MLAPYLHGKMQSTRSPRFVEESIEVPAITTVVQAEEYLAQLLVFLSSE
jgi:hypothetical protein